MFEKPTSKIYDLSVIDAEDELDVELTRLYAKHQEAAKNKSEIEFHNYLQEKASQNKREYNEVVSALLYGVLTEPNNARVYFQSISFVNRDNFSVIVNRLQALTISIKFQQLKLAVREQIFWLVSELTSLSVQSVDSLYLSLLRQIKSGDISQRNVLLCDQILKLCESQKSWLDMNPRVIATFVYTYLRVIPDHRQIQLQQLQQREIRITISLLREKWTVCAPIGRDLARVLHDLASIPEFSQLWEDILKQPQKLSPRFKGLDVLLLQPTPKEFLRSRLTPDMEFKLLYIVQNLKITMYQRNLNWFIQRYLNTPEMEPHYVDVIRYLVAGWYPSNQILQSDIVPRYVVIGSMIRSVKSSVVAANIKLALIYDWLFFTPNDNIMFIEPAMLLMERSAERYPYITAILMEFLKYAVEEYYPPMKDYISRCVSCGMRVMLSKGVIRSLMPLYKCPSVDPNTKEYMQILFSEFLTEDPSIPSLPIPSMPNSVSLQPVTTPAENKSNKLEDKQEEKGTSEQSSMENDIDVDEFLYGESENKNAVTNQAIALQSEDEDENMADIPDVTPSEVAPSEVAPAEAAPADIIIKDKSTEENSSTPEIELQNSVVSMEESMEDSDEELEEIVDDEGLQSNQSYWIFGDSLKRFKSASIALLTAQKDKNEEEYILQLLITKRSIKDIIAVFLRMAIPAEVLERTIGPYIRNIIYLNRFPFTFLKTTEEAKNTVSEEAIISDTSKDVFDLLMITFWNLLEKENEREKLLKLLSCIAHNPKKKSRRHLIGMRWWSFISRQEEQEDTNSEKWFPSIVSYYEMYVMHIRTMEESKEDSVHFLKAYLINDLRSLAEQNVIYFNHLIPLLYRYLPHVVVGNLDLLKLVLMMILPDKLGRMVCDLHFGSIRVFGDQFDPMFIDASFKIPSYETMCFWQLLAAELQGKTKVVESIFAKAQTIDILKTQFKNEIIPSLFTIISSVKPTEDLLCGIVSIIPQNTKNSNPQVQFVLAMLQYWSINSEDTFATILFDIINGMIDQIENEDSKPIVTESLINTLVIWWEQKLIPDSFKSNKKLLANMAKLGGSIGISCPKEWIQDSRRKKRSIFLDSDEE